MVSIFRRIIERYAVLNITIKATLWFIFCSTMQRIILILTTPLFTRLLTPEQYGQYTVYTSWLQIFTIITTLKLNAGGFNKGMSKYEKNSDDYVATVQTITTVLTFLVAAFYGIFCNQINHITELSTLVTIGMFVELIFSPAISFWTLRQRYKYKYRSVVQVTILIALGNAFVGLLAVLITPTDKGTARIFSCIFVQVLIGGVIYFINYKKASRCFNIEYAKYALGFALPLLPHYLSLYVLEQSDRIMIQKMCGTAYAGIYGVAYSAGMVIKIVTESTTNALVPWLYGKLESKRYSDISKCIIPLLLVVLVALTIFIAFSPEIMVILAGAEYTEAKYVIPPVTASVFFVFIYTIFANVEFFYEEKKFTMYISIGGAVLNVVLNYLLIPIYGFVAAGYTTLICYVAFSMGHYIYMIHILKKRKIADNIISTGKVILVSIIMVFVTITLSILYEYRIIRYALVGCTAVFVLWRRKNIVNVLRSLKKE